MPEATYYQRTTGRAPDGSPTFSTSRDTAGEQEVRDLLQQLLGWTLRPYPRLHAHVYSGVASLYIVRFTDSIHMIDVTAIEIGQVPIGGTRRIVKSSSDREPVIHVPVASMARIK